MSDEDLIGEFLEEALDSLTSLDEKISALKGSQDIARDVNEIFRPVHSIKGAASFFQMTGLMTMSHKLETVLDKLRQFEIELSPDISEILERGFFKLRSLVEKALGGDQDLSSEDEDLLQELDVLLNGGGADAGVVLSKLKAFLDSEGVNLPESIARELGTVMGVESDLEEDEILKPLMDLVRLQVESPSAENVENIRSIHSRCLEVCGDDHEALAPLGAFLEDFNALVDSPVGLDEMMMEVVMSHLEDASPLMAGLELSDDSTIDESASEDSNKAGASIEKAEEAPKAESASKEKAVKSGGSIRVNVRLLEDIMNLMSELVLSRNELNVHAEAISEAALGKTTQQVSNIITELQGKVMKTRLQPVSTVFNPLPGVVREISKMLGKDVDLTLEGKNTELDRGVLEGIKDPLTHILRNSLDHGFEMPEERLEVGKPSRCQLIIRAFHQGGQVVIEIVDDGRGINGDKVAEKALEKGLFSVVELESMSDAQKAEIIFHPGFSTAEQVSQVSGRGVGMDVVKSNIVSLGGQVELDSKFGIGTTLRLKIPLTLAIVPALIVGSKGQPYAIPQVNLEEMILLKGGESRSIEEIRGVEVFRLRGEILPVLRLNNILGIANDKNIEETNMVVLSSGSRSFCLVVDQLFDIEEIVVKSLDDLNASNKIFSGATILGDGSIALIFDILQIGEMAGMVASQASSSYLSPQLETSEGNSEGQVLLFSLGDGDEYGIQMKDVSRLEQVKSERIDQMNGRLFLRYREKVLPLVSSWSFLPSYDFLDWPEDMHIVVCGSGQREMGLLVKDIVDVMPMEKPLVCDLNEEQYLKGSTILDGRVISLFDLNYISEQLLGPVESDGSKERLLIWEQTPEMSAKAMGLREEGYEVTEVHSRDELEEVIKNIEVDVVLSEEPLEDEDMKVIHDRLGERYGTDHSVSVLSLQGEDGWQSRLDSDQLSDVIGDILTTQLES